MEVSHAVIDIIRHASRENGQKTGLSGRCVLFLLAIASAYADVDWQIAPETGCFLSSAFVVDGGRHAICSGLRLYDDLTTRD